MNGRIILSQADFSANNIGLYVELSALTKKVLSKQTQYGEDSVEAAALNTFLNNLTTDGFIGGENPLLKTLIIPALANNRLQTLYNIANLDASGYPIDEMNATEAAETTTPGFIVHTDSSDRVIGVKRNGSFNPSTETLKDRIRIDSHLFPTIGVVYPEYSIIFYGCGGLSTQYPNSITANAALNYTTLLSTSVAYLKYESNAYVQNSISNANNGRGYYGVSYVQNTTFEGIVGDGTLGAAEVTGDLSVLKTQNNSNMFGIGDYFIDGDRNFRFAAIAFGDKLTAAQHTTLKGYFDTLMTALHVKTW